MKILIALLSFCFQFVFSQNNHELYAKLNVPLVPVALLNAGFEYQLNKKTTLQADGFISPWKSVSGYHAQVYMAHLETRYYFREAFSHWYVGVNGGFGIYDVTKWGHRGLNQFQRGFNIMLGAVGGYQFQWKKNWNIDIFLRGGSSQGFYHGYQESEVPPGIFRYDNEQKWNKSGEWIPYGGGIMICYKIK